MTIAKRNNGSAQAGGDDDRVQAPQGASPWLIVAIAVSAGIALTAFSVDLPLAAQVVMVLAGGLALGALLGWFLEERAALRLSPAAAGPGFVAEPAANAGLWLFMAAAGLAIILAGFVAETHRVAQVAMIVVGGIILGSLAGWVLDWAVRRATLAASEAAVAPGPPRPYVPPVDILRSEARQALYNEALQDIARLRFAFPTSKYPDYRTFVNHPQQSMGIQMADGSVAYPGIVIVQYPENHTKIVAQVETNETVRTDVARYEWLPYAHLAPLYLYVPVGKGDEALALCRRFNIPVVGIRTWRYMVGYEGIEINDHYTVPSGPAELLPKFLRRAS